jgi:tetratricopeptide (TPR) repeat protein
MYTRALQGWEEALGPKHTSTLDTVGNLGNLYADQGKLAEAEAMYTRALQGYKDAIGPELVVLYLPALNSMFGLGGLLSRTDRKEIAKGMYTRALSGYRAVQGPSSKWCKQLEDRLQALQVASPELEVGQDKFTEPGAAKSRPLKEKLRKLGRRLNR